MIGMRSTLGRRASICKELGFTLDFVEHGISYAKLQMMLIDLPRTEKNSGNEEVELTDSNADEIMGMLLTKGGVIKNA